MRGTHRNSRACWAPACNHGYTCTRRNQARSCRSGRTCLCRAHTRRCLQNEQRGTDLGWVDPGSGSELCVCVCVCVCWPQQDLLPGFRVYPELHVQMCSFQARCTPSTPRCTLHTQEYPSIPRCTLHTQEYSPSQDLPSVFRVYPSIQPHLQTWTPVTWILSHKVSVTKFHLFLR